MSNADRASPSDVREKPVPIEVHRCDLGKKVLWAGLSEQITGCMTHWVKGRSRYCGGQSVATNARDSSRYGRATSPHWYIDTRARRGSTAWSNCRATPSLDIAVGTPAAKSGS